MVLARLSINEYARRCVETPTNDAHPKNQIS